MTGYVPPAGVAVAYVNHGRWVADCPDTECHGAEDTTPNRVSGIIALNRDRMVCTNCGRMWPAEWPPDAGAIVQVLMQRPKVNTRHWWPWETVQELVLENYEHGVR